ncbi:MAG TPA: cellulase family glycosylhydrolase [Candidatus Acidoferrales bacterium]|nr:cellulase family glycosylhydrolase [Candidatus Acidoferrales bacterium]
MKYLFKFFLILFALFFFGSFGENFAQSFLTVNGQKIVDQTGQEIHFRGMGLGGWLEPEGYMFMMSSFANSPSEIHDAIQNLIGIDSTNKFYDAFHNDYVTEADIEALHEWGFNLVRLPFHYNILTPVDSPGIYIPSGFAIFDSLISWCKKHDIYVILDMHCAPGGESDQTISDYNSSVPSLWQDTSKQTRTVEIWRTIADRYKNEPAVAGYDLLNEPRWDFPNGNNQPLHDLYVRITNAIRSVDTTHILFVEGNQYATDFSGLTPPWDFKMAYSFHKYWNSNDASSIQGYLGLRTTYNVPLWLGESGENSNPWYTDCISLMNKNDIGWSWWTLRKFNTITSPLDVHITSNYQQLLNYWEGTGSKPSVSFATTALLQMAERLKFQNCVFFKDVIDAMMRQPNDYSTLPFTGDTIPGTIYADNYDLGRIGYAYNDVDYQNAGGSSTTWNQGNCYRNDGVDVQPCSDTFSNGFDVGWIDTGEWMQYTINVINAGTYDIGVRYASNQTGGQFMLKMDGNVLTPSAVDVPVTGGWQNWQTLTIPGVALTSGTHIFRIQAFSPGFNVNSFTFANITDVKSGNQGSLIFDLEQNFPNPFNPSTVIDYQIPTNAFVMLKIYDVLGRIVAPLVNGRVNAGEHKVVWDGSRFPSGVYYCRMETNGFVQTKSMLLLK